MNRFSLIFLAALMGGCGNDAGALRTITVERPQSLGLSLREVPSTKLRDIGLPYGLAVVKAGTLAERSGLRVGDVVFGVNQRQLAKIEDFYRFVSERAGGNLDLLVRRGGRDLYLTVELGGALPHQPPRDTLLRT